MNKVYLIGGKRNGESIDIDLDEIKVDGGKFCVEHEVDMFPVSTGSDRNWVTHIQSDLYVLMPPMRIGDAIYYYGREVNFNTNKAFDICKGFKKEFIINKSKIAQMYHLQLQRKELEKECDKLGESIFGKSYAGCELSEEVLTLYDDCGHEFELDEYDYNKLGEEILE